MSSSTTLATPTYLAQAHVNNLLDILRRANEHYSHLAAIVRASLKPTYHAKKRAQALKLSVSIQAAKNLDQKQISTIPLPLLDRVASPVKEAPVVRTSPVFVAAPIPRYASQAEQELKRAARPALTRAIHTYSFLPSLDTTATQSAASRYSTISPAPASALAAARKGLNSRWSATTSGGDIMDDIQFTVEEFCDAEEAIVMYISDYDESMDLPATPESLYSSEECPFEALRPRVAVTGSVRARVSVPTDAMLRVPLPTRMKAHVYARPQAPAPEPVPAPRRIRHSIKVSKLPPQLDIPVGLGRLSWGSDMSSSSSRLPSSGSASSSPSNGPTTPVSLGIRFGLTRSKSNSINLLQISGQNLPKLTVSIKRKSHCSDIDTDSDDESAFMTIEKRPKYERKPWVTPATTRRSGLRPVATAAPRRF